MQDRDRTMVMTTIRVEKDIMNKLHGVRGHLDYITNPPKKHTLSDTIEFLTDDYYERNEVKK
jgi:hypothetical protein